MTDEPRRPEPPKRGRPKAIEPSSAATTWLPDREYDAIIRLARRSGASVSRTIRELLRRRVGR